MGLSNSGLNTEYAGHRGLVLRSGQWLKVSSGADVGGVHFQGWAEGWVAMGYKVGLKGMVFHESW